MSANVLSAEQRQSFREYASANITESDGTESQWASYTLKLLDERDALAADLDRFCGPICEHDGKRVIEHEHLDRDRITIPVRFICNRCEYGDHGGHLGVRCDGRYGSGQIDSGGQSRGCDCYGIHPPAPEIEEWLRRSAR